MCRCYDEVYNRHNVDFPRRHLHPDVVARGPGIEDEVHGIEQVVQFSEYVVRVYEDYQVKVLGITAHLAAAMAPCIGRSDTKT